MIRFALRVTALNLALVTLVSACSQTAGTPPDPQFTFRYDTFGDEAFWTDTLRLHEVIADGIDPETALAVGLKVDTAALPEGALADADLTDPATTVELLRHDAVVGIQGTFAADDSLDAVGVTCALCHSTVDDSVGPGLGERLDGWPNRDLDPGLIMSLSPFFDDAPEAREQLRSWGAGYYDPYWNLDGISDPVLIPPAYGLREVPRETYTGEGPVSYWNAYVAVTQMHGQGTFQSDELGVDIEHDPDRVTPKLPALRRYQFSLDPPQPEPGTFDATAAQRGEALFRGKARCAGCHTGSTFTDAAERLHDPAETGMDAAYAERSTTGRYRTTPLRGVATHPPYFHDGSAPTLDAVVGHYDDVLDLDLDATEQDDLVAYLKSL